MNLTTFARLVARHGSHEDVVVLHASIADRRASITATSDGYYAHTGEAGHLFGIRDGRLWVKRAGEAPEVLADLVTVVDAPAWE